MARFVPSAHRSRDGDHFTNIEFRSGGRMNLVVWLPAMFALGLVSMAFCVVFVAACDRI
jgi:hypothetical protein